MYNIYIKYIYIIYIYNIYIIYIYTLENKTLIKHL